MTPAEHARLDEATVRLCEETSWPGDQSDFVAECGYCGLPYWASYQTRGGRPFCSATHRALDYYRRHRQRVIARQIAYHRRRQAALTAARRAA